MLRLATRRVPRAVVWTDEIDRVGVGRSPSYTVDTVRRLRRLRPRADLRLLVGSDQVAEFHRWKEARKLLELAAPAVVYRPPVDTDARLVRVARRSPSAAENPGVFWRDHVVPAPIDPMSSTTIRRLLAGMHKSGRVPAPLRKMLDPGVLRYIRAHGLYRG
jgi:nicotinate-nucleotide adenylyltransferase